METELVESFCTLTGGGVLPLTGLGCSLSPSDPPSEGNPDTPNALEPLLSRLGNPSIALDAAKVLEVLGWRETLGDKARRGVEEEA